VTREQHCHEAFYDVFYGRELSACRLQLYSQQNLSQWIKHEQGRSSSRRHTGLARAVHRLAGWLVAPARWPEVTHSQQQVPCQLLGTAHHGGTWPRPVPCDPPCRPLPE